MHLPQFHNKQPGVESRMPQVKAEACAWQAKSGKVLQDVVVLKDTVQGLSDHEGSGCIGTG